MILIAKQTLGWFNYLMKNSTESIRKKLLSRYFNNETVVNETKSTDINILLNRVRNNKKKESLNKIYFSAMASAGLVLFGFFIF
jgi:uncharacterized hydantoinase/oxoprolinase family protein